MVNSSLNEYIIVTTLAILIMHRLMFSRSDTEWKLEYESDLMKVFQFHECSPRYNNVTAQTHMKCC